jgi:hypothetical protein
LNKISILDRYQWVMGRPFHLGAGIIAHFSLGLMLTPAQLKQVNAFTFSTFFCNLETADYFD